MSYESRTRGEGYGGRYPVVVNSEAEMLALSEGPVFLNGVGEFDRDPIYHNIWVPARYLTSKWARVACIHKDYDVSAPVPAPWVSNSGTLTGGSGVAFTYTGTAYAANGMFYASYTLSAASKHSALTMKFNSAAGTGCLIKVWETRYMAYAYPKYAGDTLFFSGTAPPETLAGVTGTVISEQWRAGAGNDRSGYLQYIGSPYYISNNLWNNYYGILGAGPTVPLMGIWADASGGGVHSVSFDWMAAYVEL